MKRFTCIVMSILMLAALVISAAAVTEPLITKQPQSADYTEGSVAIYSVEVAGEYLNCDWFIEYNGVEYNMGTADGTQPWEKYAGSSAGASEETLSGGKRFNWYFNGIESGLDGSKIYAVINDGHFEIVSDKAIISVGTNAAPPTISVPARIEVNEGEIASIYCYATDPNNSAISYLWYETSTGKLEDIVAVNRGSETEDVLNCDTSTPGTRYYVCLVTTASGGSAYSSVVPVIVAPRDNELNVIFTDDSYPQPGRSMTVDIEEMAQQDSRIFDAYLEGKVVYEWYWGGTRLTNAKAAKFNITSSDVGNSYSVTVICGDLVISSEPFLVTEAVIEPEITTSSLPDGIAGKEYYAKLECNDGDATFYIYYNPGKANEFEKTGLNLTQHGEIEGTPKTEGTYTFTVCASGEGGEAYKTFTLKINEDKEVTIEIVKMPAKLVYKVGETLDLTGLVVKIIDKDGKEIHTKNGENITVTYKPLTEAGEYEITLSYEDAEAVFEITVEEEEAEKTPGKDKDGNKNDVNNTGKPDDENIKDTIENEETNTSKSDLKPGKSKGLPWWGYIIAAVAVCGIAAGIVIPLAIKKKR